MAAPTTASSGHEVFVKILGELIGIAILAALADMNDDLGKLIVVLMAAWLTIFVISSVPQISAITGSQALTQGLSTGQNLTNGLKG